MNYALYESCFMIHAAWSIPHESWFLALFCLVSRWRIVSSQKLRLFGLVSRWRIASRLKLKVMLFCSVSRWSIVGCLTVKCCFAYSVPLKTCELSLKMLFCLVSRGRLVGCLKLKMVFCFMSRWRIVSSHNLKMLCIINITCWTILVALCCWGYRSGYSYTKIR